jgi:hypothetical protein
MKYTSLILVTILITWVELVLGLFLFLYGYCGGIPIFGCAGSEKLDWLVYPTLILVVVINTLFLPKLLKLTPSIDNSKVVGFSSVLAIIILYSFNYLHYLL